MHQIYVDNGSNGDFFWHGDRASGRFGFVIYSSIFENTDSTFIDLTLNNDRLKCRLGIFSDAGNIFGDATIFIEDNSLRGTGRVYGNGLSAGLIISSKDIENGIPYLLTDVMLNELKLSSDMDKSFSDLFKLIRSLNSIVTDDFGFQNLLTRIHGDSCLYFEGQDFQCVASIELSTGVGGEHEGQIFIESGEIYKYGGKFDIDYGLFDFETGAIMVTASHFKRAYLVTESSGSISQRFHITYTIKGIYPDSVDMTFKSDPYLKKEEIISLLVWGDPASKKVSGIAVKDMEDRIRVTLENYNSERFTRLTERQVGRFLAFDRVEVEGNSFSFDSPIQADKDLNQRLRLSVRGTVGGTTKQTISFDYRLYNDFFLVNETTQDGNTGLDLRYIIRFE